MCTKDMPVRMTKLSKILSIFNSKTNFDSTNVFLSRTETRSWPVQNLFRSKFGYVK
jgi:hypothetical protein